MSKSRIAGHEALLSLDWRNKKSLQNFVRILPENPHSQILEEWDVCYGDTVTNEHGYTVSGSCPVTVIGPNHTVNSRILYSKETFTLTSSLGLQTNCGVSEISWAFLSATSSPYQPTSSGILVTTLRNGHLTNQSPITCSSKVFPPIHRVLAGSSIKPVAYRSVCWGKESCSVNLTYYVSNVQAKNEWSYAARSPIRNHAVAPN